jgi:hypothetical protein
MEYEALEALNFDDAFIPETVRVVQHVGNHAERFNPEDYSMMFDELFFFEKGYFRCMNYLLQNMDPHERIRIICGVYYGISGTVFTGIYLLTLSTIPGYIDLTPA